MKNNLYFDADFNFLLLECEESQYNNIYLIFHTSEATDQTLNISVDGGEVQTESLQSDTDIVFPLGGDYWAIDGDTVIYLSNSDGDSNPITINFPAMIDASAALNRQEDDSFILVQSQGSSGGSADRMGVVSYINGRAYTVGQSLLRIAQITFSVGEITTALVACTFLAEISGVEDTTTLTVRLRINRSWEEYFEPKQTVSNGHYIITVTFPLTGVSPIDANIIDFYALIDEGAAFIDQQQVRASVTAASLQSSEEWTGEIEIQEQYTPVSLIGLTIAELEDAAEIDEATPDEITASDTPAIVEILALSVDELADTGDATLESIYEAEGAESVNIIVLSSLTVQPMTDSVTATAADEE